LKSTIGNNFIPFVGIFVFAMFSNATPYMYGETFSLPEDSGLEDTSSPDNVVGCGTPESCTVHGRKWGTYKLRNSDVDGLGCDFFSPLFYVLTPN
jgi:hypothetical protein